MLPDWLVKLTGAAQFADPLKNGGLPTIGDALQGIGHSMMENYRRKNGPGIDPAKDAVMPVFPSPVSALMAGQVPDYNLGSGLMQQTPSWNGAQPFAPLPRVPIGQVRF